MGIRRLVLLGLAAGALGAAGSAKAASHITGIDVYGHGVVTSTQPGGPPVGFIDPIHVTLTLQSDVGFPTFQSSIPSDATGTFNFSVVNGSGDLDFRVRIEDVSGDAACQFCDAHFSLLNGQLSGPFFFDAGVFGLTSAAVSDSSFLVLVEPPIQSNFRYGGTFALDRVAIQTDAPVPEPASWVMMLAGFLGAGAALRAMARRRRLGAGHAGPALARAA